MGGSKGFCGRCMVNREALIPVAVATGVVTTVGVGLGAYSFSVKDRRQAAIGGIGAIITMLLFFALAAFISPANVGLWVGGGLSFIVALFYHRQYIKNGGYRRRLVSNDGAFQVPVSTSGGTEACAALDPPFLPGAGSPTIHR